MILALELVLLFLSSGILVLCVPSWDGGYGTRPQSSIGNIVPGASFIEALGAGVSYEKYTPKYLSINAGKGEPGSVIIKENVSPPLFFINNQQLWQLTNQTSILRVNVMNVTSDPAHPAPYKLELSENSEGTQGGVWRWRGTMLHFDLGKQTNQGLYFSCQTTEGTRGVYMTLERGPTPEGCAFSTLHSFVNRIDKP